MCLCWASRHAEREREQAFCTLRFNAESKIGNGKALLHPLDVAAVAFKVPVAGKILRALRFGEIVDTARDIKI